MNKDTHPELMSQLTRMIAQGIVPIDKVAIPSRQTMHADQSGNILADAELLAWIRGIPDFDLIMLLSDVDQHGWDITLKTIETMKRAGV